MKPNKKLLEEALEYEALWRKSGLMDGLTTKDILESNRLVDMISHRLANEGPCWCGEDHSPKKITRWNFKTALEETIKEKYGDDAEVIE